MRLATWNLQHGVARADGLVDPDALSQAIAVLDADVLALQEVDRGQPRSGSLDLTALAAEAMGATAWRFHPTLIGDPARSWRPADDADLDQTPHAYGIALLSRHPVVRWHTLRLEPASSFRAPVVDVRSRSVHWIDDEPRAAIAATIDAPLGQITVASAHLTFVPGANARQLRQVLPWLRTLPGPRILLGDLNLPRALVRAVGGAGSTLLARGATYPMPSPLVQLDHALGIVDDAAALPPSRQLAVERPVVSDHLPVLVQLGHGAGER
ncbi:endonuclease/exonuclease/phosphatase family protein [Agrococcus sp. Marseille-P2731]|uniref:endonuclease/exonuclease/phosphatase family protein n=1 Tax=Agrococcus sp. Marseille-P2731 TaxID=1841862 RepID=UPI00093085B7|nr:endonuclease/exonuclease/phosphatase family protein [Agrococcus sp. Marseille-P2731]